MRQRLNIVLAFVVSVMFALNLFAAERKIPLEVTTLGGFQNQIDSKNLTEAYGFQTGAQLSFFPDKPFTWNLQIAYDYQWLKQKYVLDEWDWAYWEDTYIEFIPGADVATVNKTLEYTSTDSIYSATFKPTQRMKELRLTTGVEYEIPITRRFGVVGKFNFGASLYSRQLHMTEHWTKRFDLDTTSTGKFDYEFQYNLLHFAPAQEGTRFIAIPGVELRYELSELLDLKLSADYVAYLDRKQFSWLEDIFNIGAADQKWFPLNSKALVSLGITFKY